MGQSGAYLRQLAGRTSSDVVWHSSRSETKFRSTGGKKDGRFQRSRVFGSPETRDWSDFTLLQEEELWLKVAHWCTTPFRDVGKNRQCDWWRDVFASLCDHFHQKPLVFLVDLAVWLDAWTDAFREILPDFSNSKTKFLLFEKIDVKDGLHGFVPGHYATRKSDVFLHEVFSAIRCERLIVALQPVQISKWWLKNNLLVQPHWKDGSHPKLPYKWRGDSAKNPLKTWCWISW